MDNATPRRPFSARYRHRAWGTVIAIPGGFLGLISLIFFIFCIAEATTYYLAAAIVFLVPALAFLIPAIYLLRGRDIDPRPAAQREASAALRSERIAVLHAARESADAARRDELAMKYQTAEADRLAAVARREAAQAELMARQAQVPQIQMQPYPPVAPHVPPQTLPLAFSTHAEIPVPAPAPFHPGTSPEEFVLRRISGYLRISGILWIVLGGLQILIGGGFAFAGGFTLALLAIGVWNLVAGLGRLAAEKRVLTRDARVPAEWEPVVGLVVVGVFNLVVGGLVGVGLVIFDFIVRDQVLKNRALFTHAPAG